MLPFSTSNSVLYLDLDFETEFLECILDSNLAPEFRRRAFGPGISAHDVQVWSSTSTFVYPVSIFGISRWVPATDSGLKTRRISIVSFILVFPLRQPQNAELLRRRSPATRFFPQTASSAPREGKFDNGFPSERADEGEKATTDLRAVPVAKR